MTAQTATTTPAVGALAETIRLANIVTDVAVTIGALDVAPIRLDVMTYYTHGADFAVEVQLRGEDVFGVDTIAAEIPGEWDHQNTEVAAPSLYAKRGTVRFGGESVTMTVYTGRPGYVRPDETTDGGAR